MIDFSHKTTNTPFPPQKKPSPINKNTNTLVFAGEPSGRVKRICFFGLMNSPPPFPHVSARENKIPFLRHLLLDTQYAPQGRYEIHQNWHHQILNKVSHCYCLKHSIFLCAFWTIGCMVNSIPRSSRRQPNNRRGGGGGGVEDGWCDCGVTRWRTLPPFSVGSVWGGGEEKRGLRASSWQSQEGGRRRVCSSCCQKYVKHAFDLPHRCRNLIKGDKCAFFASFSSLPRREVKKTFLQENVLRQIRQKHRNVF